MEPQMRYKEKSVIIHRDENGFGLRVGGQNPVFVDCVHENGAAWKAGVRRDDRIIKVNGTLVKSLDHQQVVHMIQNCTPFVNLTLHSPESLLIEGSFPVNPGNGLQSHESPNNLLLGAGTIGSGNLGGCGASGNNNSSNNLNNNAMKVQSIQQRLHHPHSVGNNLNWLLDIGDDLFHDNQQKLQTHLNHDAISSTQNAQPTISGVSKLIVSGPNPLITSSHALGGSSAKPKLRHNRNQSSTRDNPYYYYKTVPDNNGPEANTCSSATSTLLGHDHHHQSASRSSSGLSIVRSRSSSKMSTRSTSGKYKARNLRSRLVDDLRSLTITNSQTTPSSLSTSPSSSDLSDCDDQDSSRIDCLSINTSTSSASGVNLTLPTCLSSTTSMPSAQNTATKPKLTTKRLEIIRELIDTEKTHTERLKQLNDLIYKPLKAEGLVPVDQLKMIFSCHKTLFKIHRKIYKILLVAQQSVTELQPEPLIGKALVEIFEGELGKRLETAASTFCSCQSTNTDLLNRFTRKDTKAGEFLAQVANQQMIGRLGIKDLLASCFQRLTKYPLLLDNLLKATPVGTSCGIHSKSFSEGSIATNLLPTTTSTTLATEEESSIQPTTDATVGEGLNADSEITTSNSNHNSGHPASKVANVTIPIITSSIATTTSTNTTAVLDENFAYERLCISRALHQSRQIVEHVNEAVKRAISHNKLRDIWKKTDKYPQLPVINIETEQLLHEGPLTLRLNHSRRSFEVYVLLLTHYLVLLTREGQDKYKLKYFTDGKITTQFSPIFNIDEHLATRDTATDENGFYLLCKKKDDERIYEFASQSPADRAKWKELIDMAQRYNFAPVPNESNERSEA